MTWVKICGMRNLEDALVAVEAGADAVGFVFYEKSPRYVTAEMARSIVEKLPAEIEKVGVFAGESMEQSIEVGTYAGLDALQLYLLTYQKRPEENTLQGRAVGSRLKIYPALPVSLFLGEGAKNVAGFVRESSGVLDALFLDSGGSQEPGGTGKRFDWRGSAGAVVQLGAHQNVVVAGGLTPENVGEALGILKPWGVDVASGVESRPGKKDPEKVRAFIRAVREVNKKAS